MKIRNDFVTNSSSSSFILTFKDENSIYDTLKEQFPADIEPGWSAGSEGYLSQVLSDIDNAKRIDKESLRDLIIDEIRWKIRYYYENALKERFKLGYKTINEHMESDAGINTLKFIVNAVADNIMNEIPEENEVIVKIVHGDGGEGEDGVLEHDILPKLDCTLTSFSHH